MKMLTPGPNLDGQSLSGMGVGWATVVDEVPGLPMQAVEESPFEKDTALE